MNLWNSFAGMVRVELTSADVARALHEVQEQKVWIWNAVPEGDLTIRFWIRRSDWRRLKALSERKGNRLELLERRGIYWSGIRLLHRPVLLLGIVMLMVFAMYIPSRVFFIQVEGNETVPQRLILEAAAESGIGFGASRREVRSEKMKNQLLAALPELQWAGVNTYGCVAVISVRERQIQDSNTANDEISSVVAARDGVILSCTATRGNILCAPGQAVRAGDVLISGFTDCGITVTATRAEGEIFAQTKREISALTPSECQKREAEQSRQTKYSLVIGKKRINFFKGSRIWDTSCDKIIVEYHLTLPGGFRLPVTLIKEVETSYVLTTTQWENADTLLENAAVSYLQQEMTAGTIVDSATELTTYGGVKCLTGEYACTEMIGRVRREIGEYHGETS